MAAKYPTMEWGDTSDEGLADIFKLFKQKMTLVCEDNKVTDEASIARKIIIGIGDEGLRRLNASGLTTEQLKKPAEIWKFFENQLQVKINFRIQRLLLMQMRQKVSECLDDFITRARAQAMKCEFSDAELQERIIELVIAGTSNELFRRELLGKDTNLKLDDVITLGRQHEAASRSTDHLKSLKVDSVKTHKGRPQGHRGHPPSGIKCTKCDLVHPPQKCPAFDTECRLCHKVGHWRKCCKFAKKGDSKPKYKGTRKKQFHDVTEQHDERSATEDAYSMNGFYAVTLVDKQLDAVTTDKAFTEVRITVPRLEGQHPMRVKMDTGANANALPLRTIRQMYGDADFSDILEPVQQERLTAYSGDSIKCNGSIMLRVLCKRKNEFIPVRFYVVDVPGPVILGLPTCEQLGLVAITCERIDAVEVSVSSVDDLKKTLSRPFRHDW